MLSDVSVVILESFNLLLCLGWLASWTCTSSRTQGSNIYASHLFFHTGNLRNTYFSSPLNLGSMTVSLCASSSTSRVSSSSHGWGELLGYFWGTCRRWAWSGPAPGSGAPLSAVSLLSISAAGLRLCTAIFSLTRHVTLSSTFSARPSDWQSQCSSPLTVGSARQTACQMILGLPEESSQSNVLVDLVICCRSWL